MCGRLSLLFLCNLSLLDVGTWLLTQVKTGPLLLILPLALFLRWGRKLVDLARLRLSGFKFFWDFRMLYDIHVHFFRYVFRPVRCDNFNIEMICHGGEFLFNIR